MSNDAVDKQDYYLYTRQEWWDVPGDVTHVRIHPSVRAIVGGCRHLSTVILNDGLEKIGEEAFSGLSLVRIVSG
jgi:hypothetical protein